MVLSENYPIPDLKINLVLRSKYEFTWSIVSGHKSLIHNATLHLLKYLNKIPVKPTVIGEGW